MGKTTRASKYHVGHSQAFKTHSKVSAHAMMEGNFDFNKTPLEPPGTKVMVNEKPNKRSIWGQNGV